MTANTKRTARAPSDDGTGAPPMFFRATRYREELAEEARTLRRAGKIRAAKGVEGRIHQVEQLLGALEGEGTAGQDRTSAN